MPTPRSITIDKFSRGLNTVKKPRDLAPGEFSVLQNYYPLGGKLNYRPGLIGWYARTSVADVPVTGIQTIAETTPGQWDVIILSQTGLARMTFGGNSTALTDSHSLAFATSNNVWQSVQYKNKGYAVRKDLNYILRFGEVAYVANGITPPSTAAVIADGGASTGEAGTFYGVFTFVTDDGAESDYSPISNALTIAVNRSVAWSSVDVSTNVRVVARNLYRTLPDQTGEYFFVGQIPDNTATTFTEAVTALNMGDLAPIGHTVPPAVLYVDIEVAFERLWATDGSYVYASLPEDPDSFDPEDTFAFNPDDGEPIKALKRLGTDLMVVKSGSIHALSLSLGVFDFLPRVVDETNGTCSTRSVAVGDGKMYFYSGKAVFINDGTGPSRDISTGRIAYLSERSATEAAGAVGVFYEKMGWYMLTLPVTGEMHVYDSRRDVWFTVEYPPSFGLTSGTLIGHLRGFNVLKSYIDADGLTGVLAGSQNAGVPYPIVHDVFPTDYINGAAGEGDVGGESGYGYGIIAGGNYTATPIETVIRFPGVDFGAPGRLHTPTHFLLATNNPQEVVIVDANRTLLSAAKWFPDEEFSSVKTRSNLVVVGTHLWKRFGMSGNGRKVNVTEIQIERVSNYELIISGFQLHGEVWDQAPRELT